MDLVIKFHRGNWQFTTKKVNSTFAADSRVYSSEELKYAFDKERKANKRLLSKYDPKLALNAAANLRSQEGFKNVHELVLNKSKRNNLKSVLSKNNNKRMLANRHLKGSHMNGTTYIPGNSIFRILIEID